VPTELDLPSLAMRPMLPGDISGGMELVAMAGWNQTEADWSYMLSHGQCLAIDDGRGRIVGSTVVLPYPPDIGWIGMVLVSTAHRRRGLATRLVESAIEAITLGGRVPMLDATPDGRAVYATMGFSDVSTIQRWRGTGAGMGSSALDMTDAHEESGIAADARAFGSNRRGLLADLRRRPGAVALAAPDGGGWLWSRAGRTATQVGPVVSDGTREALTLCAAAIDSIGGPIVIDIPERETEMVGLVAERGFRLERKLTRMALASAPPRTLGRAARAIAGPELG